MNWYKRSQQGHFPFYDPQQDPKLEEENAYERQLYTDRDVAMADLSVEEYIEEHVRSEADLVQYLRGMGFSFDKVIFPSADPVYVFTAKDGKLYVIDDLQGGTPTEAQEWVDDIYDMHLHTYVEEADPHEEFWSGVGPGYAVYHGTREEYIDDILQNGLEPRADTRGISNRSMGAGVFTSPTYEIAAYSYPVVIEIDVGQMKADGFMPSAGGEDPLEESAMRSALANKIGLDNYYAEEFTSDGLDPETIVFYDTIPVKYLKRI